MDVNRDIDDLLGAYAVDALGDDEWAAVEEGIARNPELAVEAARLRETAGWLGTLDASQPPTGLRGQMLDAAAQARRPGTGPDPAASPVDAYAAQVADLLAVLGTVEPDGWDRKTEAGFTVHELVCHLVAVDRYLGAILGVDDFVPPEGTETDHVAMTLPTVDARRGEDPAVAVAAWQAAAAANVAILRAGADDDDALRRRIMFHQLDVRLGTALGIRVFELWTHADDVRRTQGKALEAPSPGSLRLMSDIAVRGLPVGLFAAGLDRSGRTVKVVLTGRGGGTWSQALALGEAAGDPDVVLIADVVDFCRLASQRLSADRLDVEIEGDADLARDVLLGAAVFAA